MTNPQDRRLPLEDLKVLELGQLIAGPFATKLLGEFGADVIKFEPPGTGDPLRKWRMIEEDTSLWWHVQTRNKRSLSLDLRSEEGQALVRRLATEADVLVENFRPGTLEGWGLGWDKLSALNPALIMVRVSGYGQTGPYRDKPGFGVIGEAMGGLRYLTGHPGEPRCGWGSASVTRSLPFTPSSAPCWHCRSAPAAGWARSSTSPSTNRSSP
ncbi:hypothetical protein Q427_31800 [Halomonas sp. BC04]|nr:hypothetical protein Q427_31800 [Halomonas sp. BC04]